MTAQEPDGLPAGEMFVVASELLLADAAGADAFAGYSMTRGDGAQLLVRLEFEGRRNLTATREKVLVAMNPADALQLAMGIVAAADRLERHRQRAGGDQ